MCEKYIELFKNHLTLQLCRIFVSNFNMRKNVQIFSFFHADIVENAQSRVTRSERDH